MAAPAWHTAPHERRRLSVAARAGGPHHPSGACARPGTINPHLAKLEGLQNADEVKLLILGMLKGQKDAGLGEPHDAAHSGGLDTAALEEVRIAAVNLRNVAESLAVSVDFRQPAKN